MGKKYKYDQLTFYQKQKLRSIAAMGGKCQICGYDECIHPLQFHHIHQEEKEDKLCVLYHSSWDVVVEELRKCALLCANCHLRLHAGVVGGDLISPFDEKCVSLEIVDQKANLKKYSRRNYCRFCYKPIDSADIFCSTECRSAWKQKSAHKPDAWKNVDLLTLTQTMSYVEIGKMLGVSNSAVRKRMEKLMKWKKMTDIPVVTQLEE